MNAELNHKLGQVRALIKANKAAGALLGLQANFAWLACGGEAHVALISDRAVGQLLVTPKKLYVLANRIELPRLQDEPLRGLGAEPLVFDWFDGDGAAKALRKAVDPAKLISDTGDLGTRGMADTFAQLRYSLHPAEVARLRALATQAEAAMNLTCQALEPGMTEFQAVGFLAEELYRANVTPVVLLAAFDERIRKYRHPLPTTKKLKRHGMLVVCARQAGLIASVTRLVHFGKLPAELRRKHDAVCAIDAAFIDSTRVGTPVKDVFESGVAAYAAEDFADEWKLHHQGGPCGYRPRDYVGTPTAPGVVLENQAFAWNPSITGTKSEDTILATKNGAEILTTAQDWPMIKVEREGEIYWRPDVLVK